MVVVVVVVVVGFSRIVAWVMSICCSWARSSINFETIFVCLLLLVVVVFFVKKRE